MEEQSLMRAVDYIRSHNIDQQIEEFISQVVHERPADPYGVMANQFASRSQPPTIKEIKGREIIISTGRPSLHVDVYANSLGRSRLAGTAVAPLGTSVCSQEPKPQLDSNSTRFIGMGSRTACNLVDLVGAGLQGKEFTTIDQFDQQIKKILDGKSQINNVLTALSFAIAKASACIASQPLFLYLYESFYPQQAAEHFVIPTPIVSVFEGGQHGQTQFSFESMFIIPKTGISYPEQLRISAEVFDRIQQKVVQDNPIPQIGKGGGFVLNISSINSMATFIEKAISEAGFSPGTDFTIGIDCGASFFYDSEKQRYSVEKGVYKTAAELVQYYIDLITQHPAISLINDGISETDHAGWELMRDALISRVKVFGGDIYASQSILARRGLKKRWTDGIWLQPGQAGTITDAGETAKLFKQRGKMVAMARRTGETCDSLISDFAVAIQADYFCAGGLIGEEGVAKINQMMRVYEYLRDNALLQ